MRSSRIPALPLGAGFSWLVKWIWAPGLGLLLVFMPLLFPDRATCPHAAGGG
jgi:hypothetical protein